MVILAVRMTALEHTRHRSVTNACVNWISALIAYSYQEKKPSIRFCNDLIGGVC